MAFPLTKTSISRADVSKMQKRLSSLASRAKNATAKADEMVETAVRTVETAGIAFGLGVVQGRYGAIEVVGVPLELGAAVALHGLSILGVGGDMSTHLKSFGDGALAAYAVTLGRGVGVQMSQGGAEETSTQGGAGLSDEEMSDVAR